MSIHVVKLGENLSRIAQHYGVRYWANIYLAGENDDLRSKRSNPNLICPVDKGRDSQQGIHCPVGNPRRSELRFTQAFHTVHHRSLLASVLRNGLLLEVPDRKRRRRIQEEAGSGL